MIAPADRQLIDMWDAHGMPNDGSTRDHAVKLLAKLVAEIDELHDIINDLAICEDAVADGTVQ